MGVDEVNKDEWKGFQINGVDVTGVVDTDSDRAVRLYGFEGNAIAYGCTWDGCDYVSASLFGVTTAHRRKHVPPTSKPRPERQIPYGDMTLRQIVEELDEKDSDITRLTDQLETLADANAKMRAELVDLRRLRNAAKRVLDA